MDFSELDDILDDTDYVPTFGRGTKPAAPKTLVKNSSVKSIDSKVGQSINTNNKLNFLDINKDTKKETKTFQDFFKQMDSAEPKNQPRRERSIQPKQQAKETKPVVNKNDFNPNNILDEEDDIPAVGRRNMKPPLSRKNEDSKSVGTRKDDNKSVASVAEFKKTAKEQQKPIFQNFSIPTSPLQFEPQKQLQQTLKTQFPNTQKELSQKETTITNTVNIDFKAIIEQQLKLERQLNQKLMVELQESHKSQIERLTKLHQEQIKRRLQLKDLELKTVKQHYQLRIKSISDRVTQVKDMQQASNRISEGIRALQRAQEQFKSKALKLELQTQSKNYQNKSVEMFYSQKEKNIKQMVSKLEEKQRQFRSEKQNAWQNLERERKNNQEFQAKLLKRQRQLEDQFSKKMRRLQDQFDQKSRKLNEEQSKIKYSKLQFQQQKLRLQQQKEQNLARMKKWQESRLKMIEQMQLEKVKLLTRQTELNALEREYEMKQNDLAYMQKQISSKAKFMELQRKKNQVESSIKKKTGTSTFYGNFTRQFKEKYDQGPTVFEKSLKQLKDEYLKNLGHI